jgi:DNA-binding GntR family transcriptional regulator
MVVRTPYKGTRVAEVNLSEVHQIYAIRELLEGLAAQCAVPHFRAEDLSYLRQLQREMVTAIERQDLEEHQALNFEFHMTIYRRSELDVLYDMITGLWPRFPWDTLFVIPDRHCQSVEEHEEILKSIESGDAELAAACMRKHIANARRALSRFSAARQDDTQDR